MGNATYNFPTDFITPLLCSVIETKQAVIDSNGNTEITKNLTLSKRDGDNEECYGENSNFQKRGCLLVRGHRPTSGIIGLVKTYVC